MTKTRQPNSEYSAAAFAVAVLSEETVRQATGRGVSMLRRASDPDDDAVHLRFVDAVRLDANLIDAGFEARFMTAYQDMLGSRVALNAGHEPGDALERVAASVESLDSLSSEVRAALSPGSAGGQQIVPFECAEIRKLIALACEELKMFDCDMQLLLQAHDAKQEAGRERAEVR